MIQLFDYIFYRTVSFYKRKRDSAAITTGWGLNALLQSLLLLDLLILLRIIYEYPIPQNANKYWMLPLLILFGLLNWYRYERKINYQDLRRKWKDEEHNQSKKGGRLIILYIVISLLIPILYGLIKQNIVEGKSFLV